MHFNFVIYIKNNAFNLYLRFFFFVCHYKIFQEFKLKLSFSFSFITRTSVCCGKNSMQSVSIIENEICSENETDFLQIGENIKWNLPEEVERRQNKIFELCLGDIGSWQANWCAILSIFQCISTMHLFSFVFHVCKLFSLTFKGIYFIGKQKQKTNIIIHTFICIIFIACFRTLKRTKIS